LRPEGSHERGRGENACDLSCPKRAQLEPEHGYEKGGMCRNHLPCVLPSIPCSLVVLCPARFRCRPMTWQAHPRQVGDDVAPTSLNEGRGEGVVPELVVAFRLGLKRRPVGGWMGPWWGGRDAKCGNVPNAEEADPCHFGMRRETGFPRGVQQCRKPQTWSRREQAV